MTATKVYKIVVDYDLCEANGYCQIESPDVFEVDDDEMLIVHHDKAVPDKLAEVRRAVDRCPKAALKLIED